MSFLDREQILVGKDRGDVFWLGDVQLLSTQTLPHRLVEKAEELDVTIWAAVLDMNQHSLRQHRIDRKEGWHLKVFSMELLCTFAVELRVLATGWQLPWRLIARKLHYAGEEDWNNAGRVLETRIEDR